MNDQDLYSGASWNYTRQEIAEAKDGLRWEFNEPILKDIERHQGFIDSAEKQIKYFEKIDNPNAARQIHYLMQTVIPYREKEIEKLKSQLLND